MFPQEPTHIVVEEKDPYYFRKEVSNSDLTWLKKYWQPDRVVYDIEKAYRFGTLIDCMITEPHKINFFKGTCAGNQYTKEEFELAYEMKKSFYRDEMCKTLSAHADFQKVSILHGFPIEFEGFKFTLNVRCKWDIHALLRLGMTADIKSTTAETQKQFEEACHHFQYFRQRAYYMDIDGVNRDLLIGISKKNCKVFKVPIQRGDANYLEGKAQYQDLAFKWFTLFE